MGEGPIGHDAVAARVCRVLWGGVDGLWRTEGPHRTAPELGCDFVSRPRRLGEKYVEASYLRHAEVALRPDVLDGDCSRGVRRPSASVVVRPRTSEVASGHAGGVCIAEG